MRKSVGTYKGIYKDMSNDMPTVFNEIIILVNSNGPKIDWSNDYSDNMPT